MATYRETKGQKVQTLSADPSNLVEGQVWYNSTSDKLKVRAYVTTNSWAAGGNMVTQPPTHSQNSYGTGFGTQTSMMFVMGNSPNIKLSQTYDGTAWSAGPDMVEIDAQVGAVGTLGAPGTPGASGGGPAILFGGATGGPTGVNGYTWNTTAFATSPADLSVRRADPFGFGTVPTANCWGGNQGAPLHQVATGEIFDGTSWSTNPASMNQARSTGGGGQNGSGTTSAATIAGGSTPPSAPPTQSNTSESWNGTSWSVNPTLNYGRRGAGCVGETSTYVLVFAGNADPPAPGPGAQGSTATELWDGTSWSNTTNMANFKQYVAGAGTATHGMQAGGDTGGTATPTLRFTEEWTGSLEATGTITTS